MSDPTPTRSEIAKLPRATCELCRLNAAAPMLVDGRCRNAIACAKRVARLEKAKR